MNFGLHHIVDSLPTIPQRIILNLPLNWVVGPSIAGAEFVGQVFRNTLSGLVVVMSTDIMDDGKRFLHVSCSYRDRLPSWKDLKTVKDIFFGEDREAFQVLPKQEDYVNLHPYCLHLWAEE